MVVVEVVMETMAFRFAICILTLCVSFFPAYIVHTKKLHHRVDRLIFRSNSPFLFSLIFQLCVCVSMGFRVQRGTMSSFARFFDIHSCSFVFFVFYLFCMAWDLYVSWVLSLSSPSACIGFVLLSFFIWPNTIT